MNLHFRTKMKIFVYNDNEYAFDFVMKLKLRMSIITRFFFSLRHFRWWRFFKHKILNKKTTLIHLFTQVFRCDETRQKYRQSIVDFWRRENKFWFCRWFCFLNLISKKYAFNFFLIIWRIRYHFIKQKISRRF